MEYAGLIATDAVIAYSYNNAADESTILRPGETYKCDGRVRS